MLTEQRITENGIEEYDKIKIAIDRIKFAYEVSISRGLGSLYVAFSGGKDSIVIAELCKIANINYELHYNVTGIDHPELVYFMRDNYPELKREMYRFSMWELIVKKRMPPTRIYRYCCSELKEKGGKGRVCVTGVRWAESFKRTGRRQFELATSKAKEKMLFNDNDDGRLGFENCVKKGKLICNPIVDWTDYDVWEFIKKQNLSYCKLYDEGYKRLGCIGCPMASKKQRIKDFEQYPKFKALYIKAFDKMIANYPETKEKTWNNGQDVFEWWVNQDSKFDKNQIRFDFDAE